MVHRDTDLQHLLSAPVRLGPVGHCLLAKTNSACTFTPESYIAVFEACKDTENSNAWVHILLPNHKPKANKDFDELLKNASPLPLTQINIQFM